MFPGIWRVKGIIKLYLQSRKSNSVKLHRIKTIYQCLSQEYHKTLSAKEVWLSFSNDFEEKWNLPHCLGAMDKKNIRIECSNLSASNYYS